jgi:transcriptional regulator with XRE-family HTH domain
MATICWNLFSILIRRRPFCGILYICFMASFPYSKSVCQRLADFRKAKNLSVRRFVIPAGLDHSHYGDVEKMQQPLTQKTLEKLAEAYPDLDKEYILTGIRSTSPTVGKPPVHNPFNPLSAETEGWIDHIAELNISAEEKNHLYSVRLFVLHQEVQVYKTLLAKYAAEKAGPGVSLKDSDTRNHTG